ncbi:MAG: carbohydrate kinase family protein [Gammaproteobacteria bacterium]|jgi:adenosine kinase|nr:carbohydrate kinase family protein [Gammaproteobacteria bacterium]MBT6878328.1 carbohydrate kinase family protein [Gammaproteobacteria bacterium]
MTALICGSYAFDQIMVFPDKFKNHILPEKVHMLNVSFLVPEMRREFGGTAGNIVYNLKLLGENGWPMATIGSDFGPYMKWSEKHGIVTTFLREVDDQFTAQAFITTDMDDNQITAFHPGAMNWAHLNRVDDAKGVSIGIVSPDGREGMIEHATQLAEADIPFIFDPGQGLPMFGKEDLLQFIKQATYVTVNDYESALMQERTGLSVAEIAAQVDAMVVTLGGKGSVIYTEGHRIDIAPAPIQHAADPTGCGDAFRAGLLYGLMNKLEWKETGQIASLMGAIKIEEHGTQNHHFTMKAFKERYQQAYGEEF